MDPLPESSTPEPPEALPVAATRVAVVQICRSAGYAAARPSALRALSDVAARYLRALARSAASIANLNGRTDANLLDVARAAEELALGRGFRGASNPCAPLLGSEALKELAWFVGAVDEEPFARPMPRRRRAEMGGASSFAQAETEPPMAHVPAWLPCFPEGWEHRKEAEKGDDDKERVDAWIGKVGNGGGWRKAGSLPAEEERERVRFRLERDRRKKRVRGVELWEDEGRAERGTTMV